MRKELEVHLGAWNYTFCVIVIVNFGKFFVYVQYTSEMRTAFVVFTIKRLIAAPNINQSTFGIRLDGIIWTPDFEPLWQSINWLLKELKQKFRPAFRKDVSMYNYLDVKENRGFSDECWLLRFLLCIGLQPLSAVEIQCINISAVQIHCINMASALYKYDV